LFQKSGISGAADAGQQISAAKYQHSRQHPPPFGKKALSFPNHKSHYAARDHSAQNRQPSIGEDGRFIASRIVGGRGENVAEKKQRRQRQQIIAPKAHINRNGSKNRVGSQFGRKHMSRQAQQRNCDNIIGCAQKPVDPVPNPLATAQATHLLSKPFYYIGKPAKLQPRKP